MCSTIADMYKFEYFEEHQTASYADKITGDLNFRNPGIIGQILMVIRGYVS